MSDISNKRFADAEFENIENNTGSNDFSPRSEQPPPRFEVAPGEAHIDTDSKDQRSLSNRLAAAQKHEAESDAQESAKTITDPLAPAREHGNKPSRGAQIDAEIQQDEEEYLKKKLD